MSVQWIRRITFGGAGIWMSWLAMQSYGRVGLASDTTFSAAAAVVMMVLAATTRGG